MNSTLGTATVDLRLEPTGAQAELLNSMFEGPMLLQRLLALNPSPVTTPGEASAFLDKHWPRLMPYMFRRGAGRSLKSMEALILMLATGPQDEFRVDFAAQCSLTSVQQVRLPIPSLGPVAVANPVVLEIARLGMKHSGAFGLIATASGFEVAIDFESIAVQTSAQSTKASPAPQRPRPQPSQFHSQRASAAKPIRPTRAKGMTARDFLAYFESKVTAHLQRELAVSRQFTTTRFDDLSGWGVSGGLPSLPRRR